MFQANTVKLSTDKISALVFQLSIWAGKTLRTFLKFILPVNTNGKRAIRQKKPSFGHTCPE